MSNRGDTLAAYLSLEVFPNGSAATLEQCYTPEFEIHGAEQLVSDIQEREAHLHLHEELLGMVRTVLVCLSWDSPRAPQAQHATPGLCYIDGTLDGRFARS